MTYQGEHLFFGWLGKSLIYIAFLSVLAGGIIYFKIFNSKIDKPKPFQQMGKALLWIHIIASWSIFFLLFYLILGHYYEYQYVWQHSSNHLQKFYLLSALWEGQEGSFLLWIICQALIMAILLLQKKVALRAGVLMVIAFAQMLLLTCIMGIAHIGSNPFELLRDKVQAPIFQQANYLSLIVDGNGLNKLLQNYWMVIHPPCLFMGFALCVVPFAYVIAGLWKKDFQQWIKPTIIWSIVAACVLGLGLLMGAAWAYEDLNFGGYWAWDPVENASFVPWLTTIAGMHVLLITRFTKQAQKTALFLLGITYILVLYSTYLTRSGILGNTSAHSFTDSNLGAHILIIIALQFIPFLILYFKHQKYVPTVHFEEQLLAREFFMLIGAILIVLCSIYILSITSLPVFNKIFSTTFALGDNAAMMYNKVLVWALAIIAFLMAMGQYLKYKNTTTAYLLKKIIVPTVITMILFLIILLTILTPYLNYGYVYWGAICIAVLFAIYAFINNIAYIINVLKGKLKHAGSALSHIGFALLMIGVLISSSQKQTVSSTHTMEHSMADNVTLLKNYPATMGEYNVLYKKNTTDPLDDKQYFQIDFNNATNGQFLFSLYPSAYVSNMGGMEGINTSPDIKHFWNKDLYVFVSSVPKPIEKKDFTIKSVKKGDTLLSMGNQFLVVNDFKLRSLQGSPQMDFTRTDTGYVLEVSGQNANQQSFTKNILALKVNNQWMQPIDTIPDMAMLFLQGGNGDKAKVGILDITQRPDFIAIKAYTFPYILLLWAGAILMSIGFIYSAYMRKKHA